MINIFLNPLANNKKGAYVEKVLRNYFDFDEVTFRNILEVKNMKEVCSSIPDDEVIVIAGGDGTLTNFANEVYDLKLKQKIFYYPCGSGNDFFNDVKDLIVIKDHLIPMNEFLKSLPKVYVNGIERYFINGIGYGVDGYCCEAGDLIRETSSKKVNYRKIALQGLMGKYKPTNAVVTVDGISKEYKRVWMSPSMIGRFYGGGIQIAPGQNRLNAEKTLSNVVFYRAGKLKTLCVFPSAYKGKHVKHTDIIEVRTGHNITVKFDRPCALQIDGETVKNVTEYSVVYGEE